MRVRSDTTLLHASGAIAIATLLFCWPALVNHYPLLNGDSVGYIFGGSRVVQALKMGVGHGPAETRNEFYCLVMYALDRGRSLWPVAVFQALVSAWVLWLTVRVTVKQRAVAVYLALALVLAATTGVAWQASWMMTDWAGALGYLCLFVLTVRRDAMSRAECCGAGLVMVSAVTVHPTHLLVSCAVLCVLWWMSTREWLRAKGLVLGAVCVAVGVVAQLAMHGWLYKTMSLTGRHPPYLEARVIADGPGRMWLARHCATLEWVLCRDQPLLTNSSEEFLWSSHGVWLAHPEQREELRAEEGPLVHGALREFPLAEVKPAAHNFLGQAWRFGFHDFVAGPWTVSALNRALPGSGDGYAQSLQVDSRMPIHVADKLQWLVILGSLVWVGFMWREVRADRLMLMLGLVVVTVLVVNAFVCGVLSVVDDRYSNRVMWLVPMAVGIAMARRRERVRAS